jgi:hypothetical protein
VRKGSANSPRSFDSVDFVVDVNSFVAVTDAPGTTAPEGSTTRPYSVAVVTWACAEVADTIARHNTASRIVLRFIAAPSLKVVDSERISYPNSID